MKRSFALLAGVVLYLLLISSSVNAQGAFNGDMYRDENGRLNIYSATEGRYLPVNDIRDEVAKISKRASRNKAAEKAFLDSKKRLVMSDPNLTGSEKRQALERIKKIIERTYAEAPDPRPICDTLDCEPFEPIDPIDTAPTPGGVGYGVFYNSDFKIGFNWGSGVEFSAICPSRVGGNNASWLYLTATNRTAKGVEAFPLYYAQKDVEFKVFDWAREATNPWQVTLPYNTLQYYFRQFQHWNGNTYQVVNVRNWTFQISETVWRNEVYLQSPNSYDLIYSYDYTSSDAEQKGSWIGSWGPIVETFQDQYSNTNTLGFLNIFYWQKWSGGCPSSCWYTKSSMDYNTYIRNDNKGFVLLFQYYNIDLVVKGQ